MSGQVTAAMSALAGWRSKDDMRHLQLIAETNPTKVTNPKLYVVDARSYISAFANRFHNGGYESRYEDTKVEYQGN